MKLRLALATAAALAASAAPAAAAIDHEFVLSSAKTAHQWEGAPDVTRGSPVNDPATREQLGCSTQARPCEEVLIKVEEAGKFSATVTGQPAPGGALTTDVDAFLYKSDATGAMGDKIAEGAASGPDTVTFAKATPGFYLLIVDYYNAYASGYDGVLKFTPAAPAAAPATPATPAQPTTTPAEPAQPAQPKPKKKKASCASKAKKKFKGKKNAKKRKAALKKCKKAKKKKKK